jgi:methyltransferase
VSFSWIFPFLLLQRLFELYLSRKHRRALLARGGREFHPETFSVMAGLHVLFYVSLAAESHPWRVPPDPLTWGCLAALALVTAGRYWTIASLGENWNVWIVLVPGEPAKRKGPYRFLRHPNYLVIALELLLFPLLLRAPVTLAVFFLAGLPVLWWRIRLEEEVLREFTDYGRKFPGTRRPGQK